MIVEILHQVHSNWSSTLAGLRPWMPMLLLATLIEQLYSTKKTKLLHVLVNVIYMPVALTITALVVYPGINWLGNWVPYNLFDLGGFNSEPKTSVVIGLAYLVIFDFLFYWFHRAQHKIPFLWRYHMVHHSDTNVSASCVGRNHWLEEAFRYLFITAPLAIVLGNSSGVPFWVTAFIIYNGIFIHWNVPFRFGFLEKVLITPAFHRIHHSVEKKHFDKNFGLFTQFWDVLFKTRYLPKEEFPTTGIANFSEKSALALLLPWPIIFKKSNKNVPAKLPVVLR